MRNRRKFAGMTDACVCKECLPFIGLYTTCLPCNCSTLFRKVTLGCLPRKTSAQRTYVRPLASLTSYLPFLPVFPNQDWSWKSCEIALPNDPVQSRRRETPYVRLQISRRLQNSSERVIPLTWPGRPKRCNPGKPMSKNSLPGANWYWGRVHL